ncbi:MAG TPA: AraC family transcriptional regulator [Acidimicrobiales bacterium]
MAPVEPMVLAAWTATLVRALDAQGHPGAALADEVGIDVAVLASPESRIPLTRTTALWRLAVEVTGDPCFGIEVSRHVRPGSFQSLGLGVVSSHTLADALDRIVRFGDVVLTGERRNAVQSRGDRYELVLGSLAGELQPALEAMEAILASIVRVARFLLRADVAPLAVELVRPVRPPSDRFERFFGCEITYGCDAHVLAFDRALTEQPLPAACDPLAHAADRLARDYVERVRSTGAFADGVRAAVASLLSSGDATQAAVARLMMMSERTLQRRLHEEGTTFRDVVCDARIDLAKQLLVTERPGSHALANRLGFSEPAAFRRAFKRRTGMTPRDFVVMVDG